MRGRVRGPCVPPAEGPADWDSAAVRASGRPGAPLDPSADAGVPRPDVVRGAGASRAGSGRRGTQGIVSGPREADDGSSDGAASAGVHRPDGGGTDPDGKRSRVSLASDGPAGAG